MEATSSVQATISTLLTPTPSISQSFGMNPFEFWAMVIGTFSTVFGVIIAVLVFILGLQVWQQYKLREKAERETEAIVKMGIKITELKNEHQKLFDTTVATVQKQTKEIVEDVTKVAGDIKSLASTSAEEKKKIEKISNEIEQKGRDLRGSAISLGNISLGSISASAVIEPYTKNISYVSPLDDYVGLSVPGTKMTFDNILNTAKAQEDKAK